MDKKNKQYTDLDVWKESRKLVKQVYELTKSFPIEETYGLTNQIRRFAVSVASNIAEGCGRKTSKDSIHFFHIARGSIYELETQIFLSNDLGFIEDNNFAIILLNIETSKKLLNGFINYYIKLT